MLSNNTSGVTGVSWHKNRKKWQVHIKALGKKLFLGYFDDFNDAVKARSDAELEYKKTAVNKYGINN